MAWRFFKIFVFLTIRIISIKSDQYLPFHWDEETPQPRCGLCRCEESNFIQCKEKDTLDNISHIQVPVDYDKSNFLFM